MPVNALPQNRTRRSGYTLLELVIAASLSTLVMAGITGMILLIYQIQTGSRSQLEAVEVGRALIRQLSRDLQSIPQPPAAEELADPTAQDNSAGMLAASEDESTIVSSSETEMTAVPIWFVGDAVSLEFLAEVVTRSGRRLSTGSPQAANLPDYSRTRLIRWGQTTPDSINLSLDSSQPGSASAPAGWIIRAEGFADAQMTTTQFTLGLPVPEVLECQFQYFDGETWVETWDSSVTSTLPKAIEIRLTLGKVGGTALDPEAATVLQTLTHVIALPTQRFVAAESTETSASTLLEASGL